MKNNKLKVSLMLGLFGTIFPITYHVLEQDHLTANYVIVALAVGIVTVILSGFILYGVFSLFPKLYFFKKQ